MRQLVLEKENSEFKPVKLRLKNDLVSYPAWAEGLVNMDTTIYKQRNITQTDIREKNKKRLKWHVNPSRVILCPEVWKSHSSYVHIYFFCVVLKSFSHSPIEYDSFLNGSFRTIDGTLTGITTPGQSNLGIMVLKEYSTLPRLPGLEIHH